MPKQSFKPTLDPTPASRKPPLPPAPRKATMTPAAPRAAKAPDADPDSIPGSAPSSSPKSRDAIAFESGKAELKVRVTKDLHRMLKRRAADSDSSIQDILLRGLEMQGFDVTTSRPLR